MNARLKKLKDNNGQFILPITHPDAVVDSAGKTLTQKLSEIGTGSSGGSVNIATQQSSTFNLFNKALQANLTTSPQDTHLIAVKEGYVYSWNTSTNASYTVYDQNSAVLSTSTSTSARIPVGGRFLSVKIYGGASALNNLVIAEGNFRYTPSEYIPYKQETVVTYLPQGFYKSKWYGKSWWVLGDSISTGLGNLDTNAYASMPYSYLLAHERFIKVVNDSSSGYTIGNIYDNKVVNMPPTSYAPDIITLMAGTNDHGFNIALGTINDDTSTGTTFYARYRKTIEFLLTRYPLATIGLITPIQRKTATIDGNIANAAGHKLTDYCDAIKAIGNKYSLPVLDLYNNLGFSPYDSLQNTNFFVNADGTHPNNAGQVRMAARVGDFIERI